jgi:hypothetical protein
MSFMKCLKEKYLLEKAQHAFQMAQDGFERLMTPKLHYTIVHKNVLLISNIN